MTMKRVEVLSSPERRRRWSRAEKERLVAAMLEPDANALDIARHAGVQTSQLFRCEALSGPDFRGAAFDRGCAEYNIKIKFRNRGTVLSYRWRLSSGFSGKSTDTSANMMEAPVARWPTGTVTRPKIAPV